MNPPPPKPALLPGNDNESPAPSLSTTVRKSALLNVAIVLTSFPVLVFAGGPDAVVPALAVMAGISFLIWAATFTVFSFVSITRIFWTPASPPTQRGPWDHPQHTGVADRWMDGPF